MKAVENTGAVYEFGRFIPDPAGPRFCLRQDIRPTCRRTSSTPSCSSARARTRAFEGRDDLSDMARGYRRSLAGLEPVETLQTRGGGADAKAYWLCGLGRELLDARNEPPSTSDWAGIYASWARRIKLEWLEKAFDERTYLMMYLGVAPNPDLLRFKAA